MKIGVTGAGGFVGRHLMASLAGQGVALVRGPSSTAAGGRRLNYASEAELVQALSGLDAVVLLGGLAHQPTGISDEDILLANAEYPVALARAAALASVSTVVHLSSTKVFGQPADDAIVSDDSRPSPADTYGLSKLEAEQRLALIDGIRAVSLRPPLVYGAGVKGNLAALASALRRGIPLPFGSITRNRRTLLAVENLCDAIKAAIATPALSGAYVVCDDESLSTRGIIEAIGAGLQRPPWLPAVPETVLRQLFAVARKPKLTETLLQSFECRAGRLKQASAWRPAVRPENGLLSVLSRGPDA